MTATTVRITADVVSDRAYDLDRRRFVAQHKASAGEINGWGKTPADAKAALVANVERVLAEFDAPVFVTLGDRTAVVYCCPDGLERGIIWGYRILGNSSTVYCGERRDAVRSARRSIAQDHAMGDCFDSALVGDAADFLEMYGDDDGPRDVTRYCAWQRAAAHAHAQGIADVHSWACAHEHEYLNRWDRPQGAAA